MSLSKVFLTIRTKEEVLSEITGNPMLEKIFRSWEECRQKEFLDFCSGARGVKVLYDSFFKEIMNPEYAPERLDELISLLIGKKVKIVSVLPNDSTRIADEGSLLVTDIVVELEDGSIANVEIQKIGYMFPGERSACYSTDLLLRQYKRVRGEKGKKFSYRDIKSVYTIVFFEKSPSEFKAFSDEYIHKLKQCADTGLEIELLQKYIFVPLDVFKKSKATKEIKNELEAWLAFLCMDEPEMIIKLIEAYPKFKKMYEEIYAMCRNVENVMGLFSEELRELDRNTVQYMIDEQQDTIDEQRQWLDEQRELISEQKQCLDEQQELISEQKQCLDEQQELISEQKQCLKEQKETIDEQQGKIDEQQGKIDEQQGKINEQQALIDRNNDIINQQKIELQKALARIAELENNQK